VDGALGPRPVAALQRLQAWGRAARGTVVFSGYDASGFGNMVVIGHRFGLWTLYANVDPLTAL